MICSKKFYGAIKHTVNHKVCSLPSKYLCRCFEETLSTTELNEPGISDMVGEAEPLIQPTSTVISYHGADDIKATE